MTLHVNVCQSVKLDFGMQVFNLNHFLDDFICVIMQISTLSVLLNIPVVFFLDLGHAQN